MTSRDFCYWLQGYFEMTNEIQLNQNKIGIIKRHLNMVFLHEIDPSFGSKQKQDKLNKAHKESVSTEEPMIRC